MNWDRLREGHKVSADLSQPSEPKFSVAIDGGNYGRPYPPPAGAAKLPPLVVDAPVTPAATATNGNSSDAYRIFQESITAAHRDWQSNLAKGHEAFLRTMEAAFGSGSGGKLAEPLPSFTLPVAPEPTNQLKRARGAMPSIISGDLSVTGTLSSAATSILATAGVFHKEQIGSLGNLSRWAFLLTFAGVGLRTNLREMRKQGLRPFIVGAVGEIVIAALTLGMVLGADRIFHFA